MRPFPEQAELDRWVDDGGNPKCTMSREGVLTLSALVDQMMAKCDALGISWGDYHAAMEQRRHEEPRPKNLAELFRMTFERVTGGTPAGRK